MSGKFLLTVVFLLLALFKISGFRSENDLGNICLALLRPLKWIEPNKELLAFPERVYLSVARADLLVN